MEYVAPYGSLDPDASYVDRNTPNAQEGSKVPAGAVEHPQREIVEVIEWAGLAPAGGDLTQLRQAIDKKLNDIRVWLPIHCDCLNSNGTFDLTTPAPGTIRVPADIDFVIRGGTKYTTVQVDLTTVANKTYHVRWSKAGGFQRFDLADPGYNPTAAAETNPGFDSSFDNILVARAVTNGANVVSITNLKNKPKLIAQANRRDQLNHTLDWQVLAGSDVLLNWARTPEIAMMGMNEFRSNGSGPGVGVTPPSAGKILNIGARIPAAGPTRYGIPALETYYEDDVGNNGLGAFNFFAAAL